MPSGQLLSNAHKQHKAQHRFRCASAKCATVFCSRCMAKPYHLCFSCEEFMQYEAGRKCRFCKVILGAQNQTRNKRHKAGLDDVCSAAECVEKRELSCDDQHNACGHNCIGLHGFACLACLDKACVGKGDAVKDDEFCQICYVEALRQSPCVRLQCGHLFHFLCVGAKIKKRWPAERITFGFLNCPLCKTEMRHPALHRLAAHASELRLKADIERAAVERVKVEALDRNNRRLSDLKSPDYGDVRKFSMDQLYKFSMKSLLPVLQVRKAILWRHEGVRRGGPRGRGGNYWRSTMRSTWCAARATHCKFCCAIATWFCWGSTHFCDACHKKQCSGVHLNKMKLSKLPKCTGKDKCPIKVKHPPNGPQTRSKWLNVLASEFVCYFAVCMAIATRRTTPIVHDVIIRKVQTALPRLC